MVLCLQGKIPDSKHLLKSVTKHDFTGSVECFSISLVTSSSPGDLLFFRRLRTASSSFSVNSVVSRSMLKVVSSVSASRNSLRKESISTSFEYRFLKYTLIHIRMSLSDNLKSCLFQDTGAIFLDHNIYEAAIYIRRIFDNRFQSMKGNEKKRREIPNK